MSNNLSKLSKNTLAMIPMLQQGVCRETIAKTLGIHPDSVTRAKRKVSQYEYKLSEDTTLARKSKRIAHKIADEFIKNGTVATDENGQVIRDKQGQPIKLHDTVKPSDAIQLLKLREQSGDQSPASPSFIQINVNLAPDDYRHEVPQDIDISSTMLTDRDDNIKHDIA